ncbi:hypothetical protein ACFL6C_12030 [Myxococcota bacterium]
MAARAVRPTRLDLTLHVALVVLAVIALVMTMWLAVCSELRTDEFTYAHAAWLIAQGQEPYRDFFLHHFPLSMQLGSLILSPGSEPADIIHLRYLMVPFWLITVFAAAAINLRRDRWAALFVVLFLLLMDRWAEYATEFRPDATATPLFLFSLFLATRRSTRPRLQGFLAGLLLAAAVWASQKVLVYGAVIPAAWLVDIAWNKRRHGPTLLVAPWSVILGAVAGAVPALVYLTSTNNWRPFWESCFEWALVHETVYPPFSAFHYMNKVVYHSSWILALAFAEAGFVVFGILRSRSNWCHHPDLILIACLASTWTSHAIQQAPYSWSLVPFLAIVAILGARGAARGLAWSSKIKLHRVQYAVKVVLIVIPAAQLAYLGGRTYQMALTNEHQLESLRLLDELTDVADPIYDNTGRYVARPHVHPMFFTDKTVRIALASKLAREMPGAILNKGAPVFMRDKRVHGLPDSLKRFLSRHYQPLTRDIWIWGQALQLAPSACGSYYAIRDGHYYLYPADILQRGSLWIDEKAIEEPTFWLTKGSHRVQWEGPDTSSFHLLWLPRNRRRYNPILGMGLNGRPTQL